jgi:signal transduction histidine kinase
MNRRILLQATAPAVVIGVVLLGVCLVSAWHINRLQADMTNIQKQNVASLQAAQELEIRMHSLRFNCFLYLIDPHIPGQLGKIHDDERAFEGWLAQARASVSLPQEYEYLEAIEEGYRLYRDEFEAEQARAKTEEPRRDFRQMVEEHPIRHVVTPCQELYAINEGVMVETTQESGRLSGQLRWVLLLLGLGGPVSGLVMGYGIARGLSRSIAQLSVRVQGMAQRLDHEVGSVSVAADGDLRNLDRQLERVVRRVEEVAERLQQQQRDMLRAQQLAAVGQLAASVAHEVRNPLTAIKMLVEAAQRSHRPRPFTPENLKVVHGEVVRLEQTVQGLLDFARPPGLETARCDVREVVARAVDLVRARARQQRVELEVRCPPRPAVGDVDRGQLGNVLVNLFLNALDAMPHGGRLEVALEEADGLRVTVADTGRGIAPEMAGRLFTPFASTKPTGTGLGLSVCRRIVEGHGGRIAAAGRPEGGAVFTITLPAAEESHAPAAGR